MAELTDATGLPERTVRYYIEQGLVPPALGRGRSRYYTPRHLEELTLVATMRDQRLSVEEIRERLRSVPPTAPSSVLDAADVWRRVPLHPALELHVRDGAPEGILALAREIEALGRAWLGDDEMPDAT